MKNLFRRRADKPAVQTEVARAEPDQPREGPLAALVPTVMPERPAGLPVNDPGARDMVERLATELISSTALSRIHSEVGSIARDLAAFKDNIGGLNLALGEMREKVLVPLREELKHLRYNLGDKVTLTTTNLDAMVNQLDKQIWAMLRAQGMTDDQIRGFRTAHGMSPETPSGQELETHVAEIEALRESHQALVEQNTRLIKEIEALRGKKRRKTP